jgi:sulfur-oxidizing protein SoxY
MAAVPQRHQISRRGLCVGAASLLAVGCPTLARASEEGVRAAIAEDFGSSDIAFGDVQIDMPDFSDSGKAVPLSVTVPCSMQGLDFPETVAVYADKNPRPRIARVHFTPLCGEAKFSTRVRIDSYQDITVVARMASGQIFKAVRKVDVTYGACEEPIANEQFPPGWSPRIRLSVPGVARAGEAVDIRTIIGHPMETGFRRNARGLLIPVRIAEWFRCTLNDALAFSVKLEPAISANPYFAFSLVIQRTSRLRFEWVDTTSEIYSEEATIIVA